MLITLKTIHELWNHSGVAGKIDGTKFEAERPRQDPKSHGYGIKKQQKTNTEDLSRLWTKGPAN